MSNKGGRRGKRSRKLLKIKVLLAVSSLTLSLLAFLVSPFFHVNTVEIFGSTVYGEEEIKREMGLGKGLGNSIFYHTCSSMEKKLKNMPYIKDAYIVKRYPDTLIVTVTERRVRGYVEDQRLGVYLYIDEEGVVLDVRQNMEEQLPVIVGLSFSGFTVGEKLPTNNDGAMESFVRLASVVQKYNITNIAKMDVSVKNEIRLYIGKVEVLIGSIEDADAKVNWALACLDGLDKNIRGTLNAKNDNLTYFSFP